MNISDKSLIIFVDFSDFPKFRGLKGKIRGNKDESYIGAVNVCIVQIEMLKIVLCRVEVDFAVTRVKDDIFFVTEKTNVN